MPEAKALGLPVPFIGASFVCAFLVVWAMVLLYQRKLMGSYLLIVLAMCILIIAALRYAGKG